jgi:AcrR family transcriptional regulator
MKESPDRRTQTRHRILEALAQVITETGGVDFSVQQVADRAGVTHRTIYNHFPTRDALRDGFAERVEEQLSETHERPDKDPITAESLPAVASAAYALFEDRSDPIRAYVLCQLATRGSAQVARRRTAAVRKAIEKAGPLHAPVSSTAVAAAVRMFFSATGWHLLTEHYGLTAKEASATAHWAAKTLLAAAGRKTL